MAVHVAAVDSSGNLEYIAVVVGEEKELKKILSRLLKEFPVIHVRKLSRPMKEKLARKVISEESLSFYCFRLGLAKIRKQVRIITGKKVSREKLYRHLTDIFWATLQGGYLDKYGVKKLYICRDVEFLFKNKTTYVISELSQLADPIAWTNLRHPPYINMEQILEEDLRERISSALVSRLLKRN